MSLPGPDRDAGKSPLNPTIWPRQGGDVRAKCVEGWIWMAAILQFWMDDATVADGELFGGWIHPASTLTEYVMNAINPVLPAGHKVTWDHVISHTPWMKKRLFNFTSEEERKMRQQAILVAGKTSDLEVTMERCYNEHIMDMAAQQKKKELKEKPGPKPAPSSKSSKPTGTKNLGHGETIKIHLKKKAPGQDWTPVLPKDDGPDVGKCYETPRHQESMGTGQAGRSPLTEELLAPGESVTTILDLQYEDPEIAQAISNIPLHVDSADIKMEEEATGFEPEVGCMGYNVNLVWHSDTTPGSTSPVTTQENQLLNKGTNLTQALGTGRLGTEENPSWPITNKKK